VLGYKGSITLVGNEPNLPIDRTKLSKALIPDAEKLLLRKREWYSEASVEVVSDTVTSVDFSKKSISTKSGSQIPYTKLVLATGGTPKRLPLPGFKELSNIFVLRTVTDVQDILAAVGDKKGKKIVVVGSSFIGMEVGNALSKENNVTIIGMEKAPLERVMGEEVGKIFQKTLEKNGVRFFLGASVDSATPSKNDSNAVGSVKLKDGASIEADLVVLGVGVAPATDYLRNNKSVDLEKDGSLHVDETFQVKGLEDVFAIGDIATYPYHGPGGNGSPTRIEHWSKLLPYQTSFVQALTITL
jgi:NAD(P)H-nitrite reductase large subunit